MLPSEMVGIPSILTVPPENRKPSALRRFQGVKKENISMSFRFFQVKLDKIAQKSKKQKIFVGGFT